jgi:transposase InsO family protein
MRGFNILQEILIRIGRRCRPAVMEKSLGVSFCMTVRPSPKMPRDSIHAADLAHEPEPVKPGRIFCYNATEFVSKDLDPRAYGNGVALDFSRPGKPTE